MMIDKRDDEESNLAEVLQRIPVERGWYFPALVLRGMDGKQMNMASEQHRRAFGKPVKGPPFTAGSADQALAEVLSVRMRQREVVTR